MPRTGGQDPKNLRVDSLRRGRNNVVPETGYDPYRERHKYEEPTVCPECEAVFHEGRWTWMKEPPEAAAEDLCPACRRSRDDYPAGFLTVAGPFLEEHYESVVNTIENEAAQETGEHPLNRIMDKTREGDELLITTTDVHLARRLGEALENAYKGKFDFHYNREDQVLRGRWER